MAQASTLADWGDVTYFPAADSDFGHAQRETLRRRRVAVDGRPVLALEGDLDGPVHLRLSDGTSVMLKAVFIASRQRPSELAQAMGCVMDDTPHGPLIRTDVNKLTSIPDVYAAGDTARMPSNVMLAAADGVLAGAGIHAALIADSLKKSSSVC
jgi:thioredoxin reductase